MELTSLLSPTDMDSLNLLIAQASVGGAGAVRFRSQSGLGVIGILNSRKLLCWFASPADGEPELMALQAIVLGGIAAAGTYYTKVQDDAHDAIAKASKKH